MSEGLVTGEGFAVDASVIRADANRARGVRGTEVIDWNKGDGPSRAVREYLAALEESNPVSEDPSEPAGSPAVPKIISLTDPAARWTAAPGGPAFYAYSTNYLIDLQAGIIVDVGATPAHRTQEVDSTRKMIGRVEERFGLKPARLVGDTAYGTAPMLGWMVEDKHIAPHVPVWDKSERKTTRSRAAHSSGTRGPTSTPVRRDTPCAAIGASSRSIASASPRPTPSSTGRAKTTARLAR